MVDFIFTLFKHSEMLLSVFSEIIFHILKAAVNEMENNTRQINVNELLIHLCILRLFNDTSVALFIYRREK